MKKSCSNTERNSSFTSSECPLYQMNIIFGATVSVYHSWMLQEDLIWPLAKNPNGTDRATAIRSCLPRSVDCAYDTTRREWLAFVWGLLLLWPFLECCQLTIGTDQDELKGTLVLVYLPGELASWRLGLSEFEYHVVSSAGTKHQAANAFLCVEWTGTEQTLIGDSIPVRFITISQLWKRRGKSYLCAC